MKLFTRKWFSSVALVIFLSIISSIVIGMLAGPVQVITKINNVEKKSGGFDFSSDANGQMSLNTIYDFVLQNKDVYKNGEKVISSFDKSKPNKPLIEEQTFNLFVQYSLEVLMRKSPDFYKLSIQWIDEFYETFDSKISKNDRLYNYYYLFSKYNTDKDDFTSYITTKIINFTNEPNTSSTPLYEISLKQILSDGIRGVLGNRNFSTNQKKDYANDAFVFLRDETISYLKNQFPFEDIASYNQLIKKVAEIPLEETNFVGDRQINNNLEVRNANLIFDRIKTDNLNVFLEYENLENKRLNELNVEEMMKIEDFVSYQANLNHSVNRAVYYNMYISQDNYNESNFRYNMKEFSENFKKDVINSNELLKDYLYKIFNEDFLKNLRDILKFGYETNENNSLLKYDQGKIITDKEYYDAKKFINELYLELKNTKITDLDFDKYYAEAAKYNLELRYDFSNDKRIFIDDNTSKELKAEIISNENINDYNDVYDNVGLEFIFSYHHSSDFENNLEDPNQNSSDLVYTNAIEEKKFNFYIPLDIPISELTNHEVFTYDQINLNPLANVIQVSNDFMIDPELNYILRRDYDNNVYKYLIENIYKNTTNGNEVRDTNYIQYQNKDKDNIKTITRIKSNEQSGFNDLVITEGRNANPWNWNDYKNKRSNLEIVLNESLKDVYKIGSKIKLPGVINDDFDANGFSNKDLFLLNELSFTVVGFGSSIDDVIPFEDNRKDELYAGYAYIDQNLFDEFYKARTYNEGFLTESANYRSKIQINFNSKTNAKTFNDNVLDDEKSKERIFDYISSSSSDDIGYIKKLANQKINLVIFISIGSVVMMLGVVFISFIIKKEINYTRKQIGIFKALGYSGRRLAYPFAIKTSILLLLGMTIGLFMSMPSQKMLYKFFASSFTFSIQEIYMAPLFIIGLFVAIPIIFTIAAYLITIKYLNEPILDLINNEHRIKSRNQNKKIGFIDKQLANRGIFFNYRLRKAFLKTSKGKFIIIQSIFAITAITFSLMISAQNLMHNTATQTFDIFAKNSDHMNSFSEVDNPRLENDLQKKLIQSSSNMGNSNLLLIDQNGKTVNQTLDERTKFDYDGWEPSNKDIMISDSRYRIRVVMEAIGNTLNGQQDTYDKRFNFILPNIGNLNLDKGNILEKLSSSWFLTFLIDYQFLGDAFDQSPKQADLFKKEIKNIRETGHASDELTIDKIVETSELDGNENWLHNKQDLPKKEFKNESGKTFFGMTTYDNQQEDLNESGQYANNIFMSDISRTYSMIYAFLYSLNEVQLKLSENLNIPQYGIIEAIDDFKNSNNLLKTYDINDSQNWKLIGNPLTDIEKYLVENEPVIKTLERDNNPFDASNFINNNINGAFMTMSGILKEPESIAEESVFTPGILVYDSNTDALEYNLRIKLKDNKSLDDAALSFVDTKNVDRIEDAQVTEFINGDQEIKYNNLGNLGDVRNHLKFQGVDQSQWEKLREYSVDENGVYTFNTIIQNNVAMSMDYEIGDVFEIVTDTENTPSELGLNYKLKVVGINKNVNVKPINYEHFYVDYETIMPLIMDRNIIENDNTHAEAENNDHSRSYRRLVNSIYSGQELLKGEYDLSTPKAAFESIKTMEYVGKNLSMQLEESTSVNYHAFSGILNIFESLFIPEEYDLFDVDGRVGLVNSGALGQTSYNESIIPFDMMIAAADKTIEILDSIFLNFVIYFSFIVLLIVGILINIIVEESKKIILTLKAIGYKNRDINWIVMGSHIIGVIISIFVSYLFVFGILKIASYIVMKEANIFLSVQFGFYSLLTIIAILGSILAVSWYISNRVVSKEKITNITNVN